MQFYLKKIAKDTAWVLMLNSVNYAASFVIAVLVARSLGTEALGSFTFIVAAGSVIYLISDFGLNTLLVRRIGETKAGALDSIRSVSVLKLFIGMASALFFCSAAVVLNLPGWKSGALFAGIAAVFPRLLQANFESAIRVFGFQKVPTVIRSINSMLQIIFSSIVLHLQPSLTGVFIVILIFESITAFIFAAANQRLMQRNSITAVRWKFSLQESKILIRQSASLFTLNFLRFSIPSISIFLLEYLRNAAAVGIFSAGARFVSGIGLLTGAVYNSYYPMIAALSEKSDLKWQLTSRLMKYALAGGVLLMLLLVISANFLMDFTFRIREAVGVLKILSFTVPAFMILPILMSYYFSVHREKFLLRVLASGWTLNLIFTYILIIFCGYYGAAISALAFEYILLITLIYNFVSIPKETP